jgi:predicted DCC family thiol-disulfide oxidoreductase YuxK
MELPGPVVLYDGECGLCHRSVQFLLARDGGRLWYAPLQGETAAALRAEHPKIPTVLATLVLVDRGEVYLRSKAVLHAMRYLTRPWRWLAVLRFVPGFLLDLPYRLIARIRYRVWGTYDACTRPTAENLAHLLP